MSLCDGLAHQDFTNDTHVEKYPTTKYFMIFAVKIVHTSRSALFRAETIASQE
jgi:hypothetical protein